MTEQQKRKYYEANRVHIQNGSWSNTSTCAKEDCQNHDKYMIFVGGSQLSNLQDIVCEEHLAEYVDKAITYRNELITKQLKKAEENELKEALKLVRKTKLKEIEK